MNGLEISSEESGINDVVMDQGRAVKNLEGGRKAQELRLFTRIEAGKARPEKSERRPRAGGQESPDPGH